MGTARRIRNGLLASGVATALLATGALPAAAVEARDIASACDGAPEDGLDDAGTEGGEQETAVDCLAWYEVTRGVTASEYRPTADVRRGQMAAFLARMLRQSATVFEEPGEDEDHFTDDDGGIFEQDIDFVAKHGVVDGTSDTTYSPEQPVTRGQMAKFLVGTLEAAGAEVPDPTQDYFTDDDGGIFEPFINRVAEVQVATGFTEDEYRPTEVVSRGQMARFLARSLAELVDQDRMLPPDERNVTLDIETTEVDQYEDIVGELTSDASMTGARVRGCTIDDEAAEDVDAETEGIQFEVPLPPETPTGDCNLSFTATFEGGSQTQVIGTITVVDNRAMIVSLAEETLAPGEDLVGEIIPRDGANDPSSATVEGCGLDQTDLDDTDDGRDGIQFTVPLPEDAPEGECTLVFQVQIGLPILGDSEMHQRTLDIQPA